jgi:hypothetical protein
MKKVLLAVIMGLFLVPNAAADKMIYVSDIYIGSPSVTLGTNDYINTPIPINMGSSAGYITNIRVDSSASDLYSLYLLDDSSDNWLTVELEDNTKLTWSADVTTTDYTENPLQSFTGKTQYLIVYNDDDSYTTNIVFHIESTGKRLDDLKLTTATE